MPSEPARIPTARNNTSTGTPSRAENLLEAMPMRSSTPASSIDVLIVPMATQRLDSDDASMSMPVEGPISLSADSEARK